MEPDEIDAKNETEIYVLIAKEMNSNKEKDLNLSSLLETPINTKDFIVKFPLMCKAIYDNEINTADLKQLQEFCRHTILAYRNYAHSGSNKDLSNLQSLCSVLLNFMHNEKHFKKEHSEYQRKFDIYKRYKADEASYEEYESIGGRGFKPDENHEHDCFYFGEPGRAQGEDIEAWFKKFTETNHKFSEHQEGISFEIEDFSEASEILTTTTEIAQQLKKAHRTAEPIPVTRTEYPSEFLKNVLCIDVRPIEAFYSAWQNLSLKHQKQMDQRKKKFKDIQKENDFEVRNQLETKVDNEAGQLLFQLESDQLVQAVDFLGSSKTRDEIYHASLNAQKELTPILASQKEAIETLANKTIDLISIGQRFNRITFEDLLKLYFQNDVNAYQDQTRLSKEECIKLHNQISEFLTLSTHHQHFSRIIKHFNSNADLKGKKISKSNSTAQKKVLFKLGILLNQKNLIDPETSPGMMLFQYDQEFFIRQNQLDPIRDLLTDKKGSFELQNQIKQLIMGAGKTTVLLNLLAIKRASGDNLSILEVPEALYETNLADLDKVTYRLFGQEPYGLQFDRDTRCSHQYFKTLFRELEEISQSRRFIVTTKSSMDSLELQYQNLLRQVKEQPENTELIAQVKWLDKIIHLIKTQGDCLADEVHKALEHHEETNYTIGKEAPVSTQDIEMTSALFEFMNTLEVKSTHESNMLTLALNPDLLSKDVCNTLLSILANALIQSSDPKNPLVKYFPKTLTASDKKELFDYLSNQFETYPEALKKITHPKALAMIKLYKGQINNLLPHTLNLIHKVNYGPSKSTKKSRIQQAVAIPYGGNDEPKETSKNTNHVKTLNLTLQSNLISGLEEDLLFSVIKKWQRLAKEEFINDPTIKDLNETEISLKINPLLKKFGVSIPLSKINLTKATHRTELLEKLSKEREIIFYCIKQEILPTYNIDSTIIPHNSHNHFSLYRSYQGFSGTPTNYRTMHPSLQFDPAKTLGTDGLTFARLRNKPTPVHTLGFTTPSAFLKNALEKLKTKKLKAIIDVDPAFKGIESDKVALELSKFISNNPTQFEPKLKYFLYYQKNKSTGRAELYALPIPKKGQEPDLSSSILLKGKSKKEIRSKLDCESSEWFTYYDQLRTTGTDIEQAPDAIAILTVGKSTQKKDLAQGANRMRDLTGSQKVAVFVSRETHQAIAPSKEKLDFAQDVEPLCTKNETNALLPDHFSATISALTNFIRDDLRSRILMVAHNEVQKKADLQSDFSEHFFSDLSKSMIEGYGLIESEQDTKELFEQHTQKILVQWQDMLKKAGKKYPEMALKTLERKQMQETLTGCYTKALKNCAKKTRASLQTNLNQTSEAEQQMESQQEQQQEQQQQTQSQMNRQAEGINSASPRFWTKDTTLEALLDIEFIIQYRMLIHTDEDIPLKYPH